MRLLLRIDKPGFRQCLQADLKRCGYVVDCLGDDQSVLQATQTERFNAMILHCFSWQQELKLVQQLRRQKNNLPILLLVSAFTAKSQRLGFNAGADDVIRKPVTTDELVMRINSLLRRGSQQLEGMLRYQNLTLDPNAHQVTKGTCAIPLPHCEFAILHQLLTHQNQILSVEQLMQTTYGWEKTVASNAVAVHIHQLRKKLGREIIQTIPKAGYMIKQENAHP